MSWGHYHETSSRNKLECACIMYGCIYTTIYVIDILYVVEYIVDYIVNIYIYVGIFGEFPRSQSKFELSQLVGT